MIMVRFRSSLAKSLSISLVGFFGLTASDSGDVRQVSDPAKRLIPEYRAVLDVCPLVIDGGYWGSSMIELEPRRAKVSLASGWNQSIYWERNEITLAQLPALLSTAANSKPRPYIFLSAVGGDSADYWKMEDIVINSAFCTTPEATAVVAEVGKPIIAGPPIPLPTPVTKVASAQNPNPPIPQPPKTGVVANYRAPVSSVRVNSGFFDLNYPPDQSRQHLGVDLAAAKGTDVLAPVSGRVVANFTVDPDVAKAFLIIHADDGSEHVLGHIASDLHVGATLVIGQRVGAVRPWPNEPGRAHVHWGINRIAVPRIKLNGWGWGKAPVNATRSQAAARGWIDPMLSVK